MSTIKITEALFRKDGIKIGVLAPEDLNEISYKNYYKGNLYCPHPGCSAELYFVDGLVQPKHFRSYPKDRGNHITGCPYENIPDDNSSKRPTTESDYKYRLSDDHISDVLRKAFSEYSDDPKDITNTKAQNNSTPTHQSVTDPSLSPNGTGQLFTDIDEKTSGREQKIFITPIEELSDSSNDKILCLVGKVSHIYLSEEFAYVNFITKYKDKQKVQANVCFSFRFIALNQVQFGYLKYVKEYVDKLKHNNQQILCCCVGEVKKNPSGTFSVLPDRYTAFSINNKKLYAIIHEMNPQL